MAVPKKRTGASAQAKRRANWKATKPATTVCKNCGEIIPTHTVCPKCGFYKNVAVSIKAKSEAVEEKKETKAKKAEKQEEATEVKEVKEVKKPKATKKAKTEETATDENAQ